MAKTKVAPNPNVGRNIATLMSRRPELGSQPLLARKIGVGQTSIGRILRSDVNTSADTLRKIADAFGVASGALFFDPKQFQELMDLGYPGIEDRPVEPQPAVSLRQALEVINTAAQKITPRARAELQKAFDLYLADPRRYGKLLDDIEELLSGEFPSSPSLPETGTG